MPAAPKLRWIVLAYYIVLFLIGVQMKIDHSYESLSMLELGGAGLGGS